MNWEEAERRIRENVRVGTNVNSPRSEYRIVSGVDRPCCRYDYDGALGFIVPIGKSVDIQIPWTMLQECFSALCSASGYDGKFFRRRFPHQASNHRCHVHAVGQIFVAAGVAYQSNGKFFLKEPSQRETRAPTTA